MTIMYIMYTCPTVLILWQVGYSICTLATCTTNRSKFSRQQKCKHPKNKSKGTLTQQCYPWLWYFHVWRREACSPEVQQPEDTAHALPRLQVKQRSALLVTDARLLSNAVAQQPDSTYSTLHSPWMSNTCQVCVIHWSRCSATRGCSLLDFSQFNREVSISGKYNQLPLLSNQRAQHKYYSRVSEKMRTVQSPTDLLSVDSVQPKWSIFV